MSEYDRVRGKRIVSGCREKRVALFEGMAEALESLPPEERKRMFSVIGYCLSLEERDVLKQCLPFIWEVEWTKGARP